MPRRLVLIGSGETGPAMVTPHQQSLAEVPTRRGAAVFLDTPYGFQQNADELTTKISNHFQESVGRSIEPVSLRSAELELTEVAQAFAMLDAAEWVFAGPGSPTYALRAWGELGLKSRLESLLERGTLVLASAAAVAAGKHAVPVYEIYKVGSKPEWWEGLDLLGAAFALSVAVIPHFNNAEGGSHDTRYCYLGEQRLQQLEAQLPAGAFVLGIDEHTGITFDLDADTVRVFGRGQVTLRRSGAIELLPSGSEVSLAEFRELAARVVANASVVDATPARPLASPNAAAAEVAAAVAALPTAAVDRTEIVRPFVEALLKLREAARGAGRWADADAVRDLLDANGVVVEDGKAGSSWRLAD